MQKNLYYRGVIRRRNLFGELVYGFFFNLASYPRMLLEVFIRKNFGERYFRLSSALTVGGILTAIPFLLKAFYGEVGMDFDDEDMGLSGARGGASSYLKTYYSWFAFVAMFLVFSFIRWFEIKRNPSVYDFAKYSLYAGQINTLFYTIPVGGKKPSMRIVETLLEPLPFLILGIVLYYLLGQKVGMLLIVCSIFYCMGYVAAYNQGDNFVMDKIDEIICNEELKKAFVDGADESQTRGFRFVGHVPDDPEKRRQILPLMLGDDEDISVAT